MVGHSWIRMKTMLQTLLGCCSWTSSKLIGPRPSRLWEDTDYGGHQGNGTSPSPSPFPLCILNNDNGVALTLSVNAGDETLGHSTYCDFLSCLSNTHFNNFFFNWLPSLRANKIFILRVYVTNRPGINTIFYKILVHIGLIHAFEMWVI